MDNAAITSGKPDIPYDEDDGYSTTQPLSSSPGSTAAFKDLESDEDDIDNISDVNSTESDDDEATIVTAESENNTNAPLIKGSYDVCKIAWKDIHGGRKRVKEIQHTNLNVYMNTSANTAMFSLSTYVTLKGSRRKSNKQHIYLLMPPERIHAITVFSNRRSTVSGFPISNNYALHFSLRQGPDCVGPEDRHIASKRTTQEQLAFMQDLAMATQLTFYLASSDTVTRGRQDFKRLATIFSLKNTKNRPRKDKKVGNLATLYAGKGGKVINENDDVVHAGASPPSPPPYTSAVLRSPLARSKKRRLDPSERPELDSNDEGPLMLMSLLRGIHTRLDDIEKQFETRLDDIENQSKTRHDDLKSQLETRLDGIENQLEARFNSLQESIGQIKNTEENLDTVYTPCRYDSTERDFLVQAVDERCEEYFDAFQVKSYEANEDLEKERDDGVTAIREEVKEATSDLHDTVASFREVLQNASNALKQFS
ncbi:hypothetical protein V8C34DRAFT_285374 [Trichoderma compactum]